MINNKRFGSEICKAIGLDPKTVRGLEITIPVNGIATVDAEILVRDEEGQKVLKVFKKYNLEAIQVKAVE